MAYAYAERYVSALQTAGNHAGTEGDPWTIDEACLKVAPGDRVNVKGDGEYNPAFTTGNECQFGNALSTLAYPVSWRGYSTTIGDGGKAIINVPSTLSGGYNVGNLLIGVSGYQSDYSMTFIDLEFRGSSGSTSGLMRTMTSCRPLFYRCKFKNTTSGTTSYRYMHSLAYAIHFACEFECSGPVTSGGAMFKNDCQFYGCRFTSNSHIAESGTFNRCVLINTGTNVCPFNPVASTNGNAVTLCTHCVIDGYDGGITLANTPIGVYANNIISNATLGFVMPALSNNTSRAVVTGNRFYNVGTPFSGTIDISLPLDEYDGNHILSADPFVDASGGDYTLNSNSTAINAGFPSADFSGETFKTDAGAFEFQAVEADYADEADTRYGVVYANGSKTGTLVVPAANKVDYNTTFDNGTVGTSRTTITIEDTSHVVEA